MTKSWQYHNQEEAKLIIKTACFKREVKIAIKYIYFYFIKLPSFYIAFIHFYLYINKESFINS